MTDRDQETFLVRFTQRQKCKFVSNTLKASNVNIRPAIHVVIEAVFVLLSENFPLTQLFLAMS